MTEVFLHGLVSKKFKNYHKFKTLNRPVDAILAIDANYDGFKSFFIKEAEKNYLYELVVDGSVISSPGEALGKREIKQIDIIPCVAGSGAVAAAFAVNLTIGLVMAGIQYLMTPIPENEPATAIAQIGRKSFFFASKDNETNQYDPVPIGYGALRVGSKVISTSITSVDMNKSSVSNVGESSAGSDGGIGGGQAPGGGSY